MSYALRQVGPSLNLKSRGAGDMFFHGQDQQGDRQKAARSADPLNMTRDKLVALALIRASILEDTDSLTVLMNENECSPGLVADLVCIAAGILEHGIGVDRSIKTIDGWLSSVMNGELR